MFFADLNKVNMDDVEPLEIGGPVPGMKQTTIVKHLINEPCANIGLEDFPGGTQLDWAFWHDEAHYVLEGKAELTYTLPPNHNRVKTVICEKGHVYLIMNGTRATWKVLSNEPYRHLCFIMPRYNFDKRLLRQEL